MYSVGSPEWMDIDVCVCTHAQYRDIISNLSFFFLVEDFVSLWWASSLHLGPRGREVCQLRTFRYDSRHL